MFFYKAYSSDLDIFNYFLYLVFKDYFNTQSTFQEQCYKCLEKTTVGTCTKY